jgi:hypothetical protein
MSGKFISAVQKLAPFLVHSGLMLSFVSQINLEVSWLILFLPSSFPSIFLHAASNVPCVLAVLF